ncbi:MAG: hypothetical protein ACE5FN_06380 [Leptospirillia bacterium]
MELTELTAQLESLLAELGSHRTGHLAGRLESLDTAHIYGHSASLMLPDVVRDLRSRVQADPDVTPLLNAVVRAQIDAGCAPVTDRLTDEMDHKVLKGLEEKWFYHDSNVRIAAECNRKQRKVLDQARRRVLANKEAVLEDVLHRTHTLMIDRGFSNYAAMCEEISGTDIPGLLDEADGFLEDSHNRYLAVLAEALREAGIHPDDARYHDLVYLFAGRYGPAAGFGDPETVIADTLAGMGMPWDTLTGVMPDLAGREEKRPGIHVVAVRIPGEIHLVAGLSGGWDEWPRLLGAAGLAAAMTSTPENLPLARRWPGDIALADAYTCVFASLAGNPAWLERHAPAVKEKEQVRRYHLWWLYRVRYLAGTARYAQLLHGPGEPADKADMFEHATHRATGARIERDYFLTLTEPYMAQAQRFKGQFFGAQLLAGIEERFGPEWFAEPGAGAYLGRLWEQGWSLSAVAEAAGIDDPGDVWPLTERLEDVLGTFEDDD